MHTAQNHHRPSLLTFAALGLAGTLACPFACETASAQSFDLRTVAVAETPAPGLPAGTSFHSFDSPRVNERGDLAFWAKLVGPGIDDSNDGSIWTDRAGTLALVYREDGGAPFGADIRYAALPLPAFNNNAELAFTAGLTDQSGPAIQEPWLGIFKEDSLFNIFPVAREGSNMPGLAGNAASLPMVSFNNAGDLAFTSADDDGLGTVTSGAALYSTRGSLLNSVLLALSGTPATGTAAGLDTVHLVNPAQNDSGVVAYRAAALDPTVYPEPDDIPLTLWRDAGAPELIAWTDPSTPALGEFHFTDLSQTPHVDHDGRVTFWARRAGSLIAPENDSGLWRYDAGANTSIVQEADAAPGTAATFKQLPRQFAQTPFGRIAFTGHLTGAGVTSDDNSGIWTDAFTSSLELLVREGDAVPGLTDVYFGILSDPSMNHVGQVAFTSHLRGSGVNPLNTFGLFATDQTGAVHLIARMGEMVSLTTPVNPDRFIREVTFTHDAESGRSQFAADGRLIFTTIFTDWSSAILETTVGCRADVNADGALDIFDFLGYQNYFVTGDPRGDFVPDNVFDIFDFLAFQNAYVTGCP